MDRPSVSFVKPGVEVAGGTGPLTDARVRGIFCVPHAGRTVRFDRS